MGGVGVIERFAKDVLRVLRQMRPDGWWEIGVDIVGDGSLHCVSDRLG